jgi:hypothetical protein
MLDQIDMQHIHIEPTEATVDKEHFMARVHSGNWNSVLNGSLEFDDEGETSTFMDAGVTNVTNHVIETTVFNNTEAREEVHSLITGSMPVNVTVKA